jgi:FtsH-binding integral membrane protein
LRKMYVPNFIPDPLEIPGAVTQRPYRERVGFIKRVNALHALSMLAVAAALLAPMPVLEPGSALVFLGVCLLLFSMLRTVERGRQVEAAVSAILLPVALLAVAVAVRSLVEAGVPAWSPAVGVACAVIYAMLCGRDFSFVGQYLLALVVSTVALAVFAMGFDFTGEQAAIALGLNAVILFYFVYDTASLLARRRPGEELAAVADLYRDVFNFFGFGVQMGRHWRKHGIWQAPK